MTSDQPRRRAAAMSSDERRTAIVQAVLPLLAEHGANITTRQIAQAAGIAEGTVFRVFSDKDELLRTCVAEAFRTDRVCARIREVPADQDIDVRLTEAGQMFVEHFERLGELIQTLATTGYDVRPHGPNHKKDMEGPKAFMRDLVEAITCVLTPDRQRFRIPIEQFAWMHLGLLMSMRFDPSAQEDRRGAIQRRVDVLLRGALTD